jgi:hypothetical protein
LCLWRPQREQVEELVEVVDRGAVVAVLGLEVEGSRGMILKVFWTERADISGWVGWRQEMEIYLTRLDLLPDRSIQRRRRRASRRSFLAPSS